MPKTVQVLSSNFEGWKVVEMVDDDNHLNVYLEHIDVTDILEIDTQQGSGKNGEQMALRFTTQGIEDAY